jgi:hypothetical protein
MFVCREWQHWLLPRPIESICLCAGLTARNYLLQDLARTWRVAEALEYGMIGCNEVPARHMNASASS